MNKNLIPNQFEYAGTYVEGQRSSFTFKKPVQATFMSGMLNPLGDPIPFFPGIGTKLHIDANIRSNTLVVPPLDPMYIDFITVWIPHRLVFNHFPQFLGENDATAWTQSLEVQYPTVKFGVINNANRDWLNAEDDEVYAGFGLGSNGDISLIYSNFYLFDKYGLLQPALHAVDSTHDVLPVYNLDINVMSARGYYLAWNFLFRDENYQRPVLFSKGDVGGDGEFGYLLRDYTVDTTNDTFDTFEQTTQIHVGDGPSHALLMPVNKFHDAFTSVLPQAQFGDAVLLPLEGSAPLKVPNVPYEWMTHIDLDVNGRFQFTNGTTGSSLQTGKAYADLSQASLGTTINEFRISVMTQRYLEALARGGRRVPEYYESIYNVRNSAAHHDYPEVIARSRYVLGVNQVIATADGSGSDWTSHLGDTGAFSYTQLRDIPCSDREFTEFGYLHVFYCVRAANRYSQMIQPHFLRKDLLEEYNPYFDHIGDTSINNLIVNTFAKTAGNFGFQEAWWDERTQLAMSTGCLNKVSGMLKYWVIGDVFDKELTACSPEFLTFDPAVLNDVFVTPYYSYPQFTIDAVIRGVTNKRMSLHSIPGISGRI